MIAPLRYLFGCRRLRVTGAAPEDFLNALSRADRRFWEPQMLDGMTCTLCVTPRHYEQIERLAERSYCEVETVGLSGLAHDARRLLRRPALLIGLLLAVALSFLMQTVVWGITVEGNERVPEAEILSALEEQGVRVGAFAPSIEYSKMRNRVLETLPALSWIAVNRSGSVLHVQVNEREFSERNEPPYPAAHLVAVRDARITELVVLEGVKECAVGDTVAAGQVLVSGYEDYGVCVRGVCAEGEIFGETWYTGTLVAPAQITEKHYTGREKTQRTLVVGRKRINLCGNSGIFPTGCDKMISVKQLSLPEYPFPVWLETVTYREYTLVQRENPLTREQMLEAFQRVLRGRMLAGEIRSCTGTLTQRDGLLILEAEATCEEMIARTLPVEK